MKPYLLLLFSLPGFFLAHWSISAYTDAQGFEESSASQIKRDLVWGDEFDNPGSPDPGKWKAMLGGHGWGNNELQYYTSSPKNARVEDGMLIIEAHREDYEGMEYTSARLSTKGIAAWNEGRIEVRAKLPAGRGVWPAIWMLGEDIDQRGWPDCGEIDIMEYVGYWPDTVHATVHTEAFNHVKGTQVGTRTGLASAEEDFHVYWLEWERELIRIGVDEDAYFAFAKTDTSTHATWPFETPHFLLLNVAVGGNWGGAKGVDTSIWPQRMLVDYVRVYQ